jgi:hypothetical protein
VEDSERRHLHDNVSAAWDPITRLQSATDRFVIEPTAS